VALVDASWARLRDTGHAQQGDIVAADSTNFDREAIVAKRILVVEDERIVARDLCRTLEGMGFQVGEAARSADEAMERTEAQVPDLVLMDIRIKGDADGIDVAAELKRRYDVPVVFLTASSDEGTRQRALQTQPYGYLPKPFTQTTLRTAIEVALKRHGDHAKLREVNQQLAAQKVELEKRATELSLLGEMGDFLQMCDTADEVLAIVERFGRRLFPEDRGTIYLLEASGTDLRLGASWGQERPFPAFDLEGCRALRGGRSHCTVPPEDQLRCAHLQDAGSAASLCIPMVANGTSQGVLSLAIPLRSSVDQATVTVKERLATVVAQRISLTLTNLRIRDKLKRESILDPLTGLFNRRHMASALERELRLAARSERHFGVLIIDVDHFKKINDQFGHAVADKILCEFAALLRARLRVSDVPTRYGGDEAVVLLPDTTLEGAQMVAEKIRLGVKNLRTLHAGSILPSVSISVGVAAYPGNGEDAESLMRAADKALYAAKAKGRDCVAVANGLSEPTALVAVGQGLEVDRGALGQVSGA